MQINALFGVLALAGIASAQNVDVTGLTAVVLQCPPPVQTCALAAVGSLIGTGSISMTALAANLTGSCGAFGALNNCFANNSCPTGQAAVAGFSTSLNIGPLCTAVKTNPCFSDVYPCVLAANMAAANCTGSALQCACGPFLAVQACGAKCPSALATIANLTAAMAPTSTASAKPTSTAAANMTGMPGNLTAMCANYTPPAPSTATAVSTAGAGSPASTTSARSAASGLAPNLGLIVASIAVYFLL